MSKKWKIYLPRLIFITFFVSFSLLFYYSSPEQVISFIGAENGYFIIFILALIGGLTTFSGVPYHLVLLTLAAGGLNPLLLGLCTAVGVMLGDTTSYFIGYGGREVIPEKIQKYLHKLFAFGAKYPRALPVFFFLFGALTPLSNDFIVISAGLAKYPFKKVMIPLALGNLVFNIMVAYLGFYAYSSVAGFFGK